MGAGPVQSLDEAAPGVRIRSCRGCEAPLCARLADGFLILTRDDGLRLQREVPAPTLEALGPARAAVYLQSLVLEADLSPRRPPPPSPALPTPSPPPEPKPEWRVGPLSASTASAIGLPLPVRSDVVVRRSGHWRLGTSAGARWRSPGLLGPVVGLDLAYRFLRLHLRGDLPSEGRVGAFDTRVSGFGGGLGMGWSGRSPGWSWGFEGGLRWDWLQARLEDAQGPARGQGALVGLGAGLHGALSVRRLELQVGVGADAFPGGFQLRIDGEDPELPRLDAWGLTAQFGVRWRP